MRLTIACPWPLITAANHLAMVVGAGPADGRTFGDPAWQDSEGRLYAAASLIVSQAWFAALEEPPLRPEWDIDAVIDIAAASRAHAVIDLSLEQDTARARTVAQPDRISAIGGFSGCVALDVLGLSVRPLPEK